MLDWTIAKVLKWSFSFLDKHQIDAPRLTAELLLAQALGCKRMDLYLRYDQPLEPTELKRFREALQRRVKHEPTQYILGQQEFWSLPLEVDQRVLIPRPETECIVEEAVRSAQQGVFDPKGPFLEIGVGSGALSIALAQEFPEATFDAVDISEEALEVAQKNIQGLGLSDRITLWKGDGFSPLPSSARYTLIVSNPPYIRTADLEGLQAEVRLWEPRLALDGGEDGLRVVRRLLKDAPLFLTNPGLLLIEIGSEQGKDALALAEKVPFSSASILLDYARLDRILRCAVFEGQAPKSTQSDGASTEPKEEDAIG